MTTANDSGNPEYGYYVVALSIKVWPWLDGYWGIWEVVPENKFPGDSGLGNLLTVVAQNLAAVNPYLHPVFVDGASVCGETTGIVEYITATTAERIALEFGYGVPMPPYSNNPIRKINNSTALAHARYGNLSNQAGIKSFPLIEVRQVDENYDFTDTYYVTSNDSGKVVINNPWMEWKIELDASDTSWYNPMRREEINTYYIHAGAEPSNPGEFTSWDTAYETVKAKMAQLSSYDRTIRFVYVSPEGTPIVPPSNAVYEPFPLSGSGTVPFVLEGLSQFP